MLAPQSPSQVRRIKCLISEHLMSTPVLINLTKKLDDEVTAEYEYSLRKGIGRYFITV